MAIEILAPTTGTGTSTEFKMTHAETSPHSISANGIAGAETVTLQFHNGVAWVDYYKDGNATPEQITVNNSMISIWGVGRWRGVKSATVAAVPIYLHSQVSP